MNEHNKIIIFQKENFENVEVQVVLEKESIWMSQKQIGELFEKETDTIGLHLKNIFSTNELIENATTEEYSVVQIEGNRKVKRKIKFYNLDAIISVGYRVNSKRGTQFRIWATKVLKDHLVKGYTFNQKRLKELKQSIQIIKSTLDNDELSKGEAKEIVEVLSDYALGLDVLDGYDHQRLELRNLETNVLFKIDYNQAKKAIEELRLKFGGSKLFGNEKDDSFNSSINVINQTFDGQELYSSLEEKAAHLLYFVTKNHSFSDGNKRIAAWLFVWYLNENKFLYNSEGKKRIENNALVALTLMIAQSKPEERELIIKVIINLINCKNN